MITAPYEDRVRYLRSRTDTSNRNLEKAFVPEFIDGVAEPVTSYVFEDDYVTVSSTTHRVFKTESILFNGMDDRTRTVIDSTITVMGKFGETFNDLSKVVGIPPMNLVVLNKDKYLDPTTVGPNTSTYGVVIDTGVAATLQNLIRMHVVKPFVCFLDGLFIPMEKICMKTDLYNDYILIDITWMKDKTLIKDYGKLDILQYLYLSPVPTDNVIFTFDGNGSITTKPTTAADNVRFKVYSNDPHVFSTSMFVDSLGEGTFGTMFNERVPGLHYKNKVKPENVFCFQDGKLCREAEVICNNFNVITVRYPDFKDDSRAVVVYSKPVQYTEDNTLRLAHNIVNTLGEAFEDFLDDTELSCQTFINEIYALPPLKYGLHFTKVHINNAEEYPTPWDEIITYDNQDAVPVLYHLINEIFEKDTEQIRTVMKGIVDAAYQPTYSAIELNDEWMLRKNLPEMFSHEEKEDPRFFDGMGGLNSSFDFFFYDNKSFEENFEAAIEYIASYDSDKLECGLERFEITATTTGEALEDFIDASGTLTLSRGAVNRRENYVMIFVNGNLYSGNNRITYEDRVFHVSNFNDVVATDKVEFVFFLKCDNTIMPLTINDSVVTTEFLYDKDEVQLWSDKTPNGVVSNRDQVYKVPFYITDPWVRGHGSGPLPSGGGVEFINGPVIYFDDSDIGYDAFINIYSEAGLAAVNDYIDDIISDATVKALLHDAAQAAYDTEFPKSTTINSYSNIPTDPANNDIIFYVGDDYGSFVRNHHYQYHAATTSWDEYFSTADQSNMYSELSLRSNLADTLNSGGSSNAVETCINQIDAYCRANPDNGLVFEGSMFDGYDIIGFDSFYMQTSPDGMEAISNIINTTVPADDFPVQNGLLMDYLRIARFTWDWALVDTVDSLPASPEGPGVTCRMRNSGRFYRYMETLTPSNSAIYTTVPVTSGSATVYFNCTSEYFYGILDGDHINIGVPAFYTTGNGILFWRIVYPEFECKRTDNGWCFKYDTELPTAIIVGGREISSSFGTTTVAVVTCPTYSWAEVDVSENFGKNTLRMGLPDILTAHVDTDDEIQELMDAIYLYSLTEEEEEPEEPGGGGGSSEPVTDWYLIPDPEMYKLALTPSALLFWDGSNGWTTSKRQFRYNRVIIETLGIRSIELSEDFKFCTNPKQYMIFVNGRCLPRSYVVIAPSKGTKIVVDVETLPVVPDETYVGKYYHYIGDEGGGFLQNHYYMAQYDEEDEEYYWVDSPYTGSNPVGHITFYSNITLSVNDVIDIYYVPDEMCVDFNEEVLKRTETTNSGYIKIERDESMTGISRNSSFIFINGRKISYDEIRDISSDMVKVTDEYPNPESMTLSLEVYRYLYTDDDTTLKDFGPDEMDDLVPEKPDQVDYIMDTHTEPSGTGEEDEVFSGRATKDAVKQAILLDYATCDDNSWLAEF